MAVTLADVTYRWRYLDCQHTTAAQVEQDATQVVPHDPPTYCPTCQRTSRYLRLEAYDTAGTRLPLGPLWMGRDE